MPFKTALSAFKQEIRFRHCPDYRFCDKNCRFF